MKRTTIVLPDDLAALLERERRRRGVSAAAIVRDALDAYLGERRKPLAIAALGRSGYPNTARDAEEILAREWTYESIMGREDPARPRKHRGNVDPTAGAMLPDGDGAVRGDKERGDDDPGGKERNGGLEGNGRGAHDNGGLKARLRTEE